MTRRRGLSADDRAVWDAVTRSVARRHPPPAPDTPARAAPPPDPPAPQRHHSPLAPTLPSFRVGQTAPPPPRGLPAPAPASPAARMATQPLRMDAKTHRRMVGGKLRPEARLDLHGMTLAQAHPELIHFVLSAHSAGLRLVLVITGKGRGDHGPLPTRPGALRHQLPVWLHQPPLAAIVQQSSAAHFRHGGEGAYYLYLRR